MRTCTKCGQEKDVSAFVERSGERTGEYYSDCKPCRAIALKEWRKRNPSLLAEQYKRHYRNCAAEKIKKVTEWRRANPERHRLTMAAWVAKNKDWLPEMYRINSRRWAKANPHKVRSYSAKYRTQSKAAMPKWANPFFIFEIYDLARRRTLVTGVEWVVDHIVPLQSKLVCGLHVENNLQVIPDVLNARKGNRHWPGMP